MHKLLLAVTLPFAAVSAQEGFQASRFLPDDYRNVMHADFAKLRATGVWDELNSGMMKAVFGQLEQALGTPFSSLDRVTLVPMAAGPGADGAGPPRRDRQIVIWEGNTALEEPADVAGDERYVPETIGGFAVKRRDDRRGVTFLQPRPEVRIQGATDLLRPILEREHAAGRPAADLLSLLSMRRQGLLLYVVIHLADERLNDEVLKLMFPAAEWPDGGRPDYMLVRMSAVGDPDDPRVELETVFRHPQPGDGVTVTATAVDTLIEKGLGMKQLRMVAPLLEGVVRGRDGGDLSYTWDLGRARTAAGHLAAIALPLFAFGTTAEPPPLGKDGKR